MTMPPTSAPPMRPRKPDSEDDDCRTYRNNTFATMDYHVWHVGRLRIVEMDLSRLRSAGVPVLLGHQGNDVVGRVLNVIKAGDTWKSDYEMPKIPANSDTFDRLDTGLIAGISVGASVLPDTLVIDNEGEVGNIDDLLISTSVVLIEQSLTPIPLDARAGLGRSLNREPTPDLFISPEGITSLEVPGIRQRLESLMRTHNQNIHTLRRETQMTTPTIDPAALERAVAERLAGDGAAKQLTAVAEQVGKLQESFDAEQAHNMEFRQKLDQLQFQPAGAVLQLSTWKAGERLLDLGKILRLTQTSDAGFPPLDRAETSLEESILEREELSQPGRDTVARIPWAVLAEREKQVQLQRSAMTDAAGSRPLDIHVLGNAGLVLSSWSPILARMDVRFGVSGAQKAPWLTAQPTAAAGAEGAAIPVTNITVNNTEYLPKSLASAYELTSSLRGVDDGTFEGITRMAITDVLLDQVTGQILVGGGTDEIDGLWGLTGVPNFDYGASQSDFTRQDVLDFLDSVRLAKTDGGFNTGVLSTSLWKLCESVLRGGTASDAYLLESMMPMGQGMGMMGGYGHGRRRLRNDGRRGHAPLRRPQPCQRRGPRDVP